MKAIVKIYVGVIVLAVLAIAAAVYFTQRPANVTQNETRIPVLLYADGLPNLLYNLTFSGQKLYITGNNSTENFSLGSFRPYNIAHAVMDIGSFDESPGALSFYYTVESPRYSLNGINQSFGNGSIGMRFKLGNITEANAMIIGLRLFPLENYGRNSSIELVSALYPLVYYSNVSNFSSYILSRSAQGSLNYNISHELPLNATVIDGRLLEIKLKNQGNSTVSLEDVLVSGYFLGESNGTTALKNLALERNLSYPGIIAGISNLGINISLNSTEEFLQTNSSKLSSFESLVKSGQISSASQLYSDLNSTLNVSRLSYLESLMQENKSYYAAMHYLDNFNPENGSVVSYADRISSWENINKGIITLNVSSDGTLVVPMDRAALNDSGYVLEPGSSASFYYNMSRLNGSLGQTALIPNATYSVFAYFNGVEYSEGAFVYR